MSQPTEPAIEIRTPCPKRWQELVGDERKRFCSECCLHVHNATELTRREARALVSESTGRVCMRIEYDATGAPVHRRSRLVRWALTAGAALLAACGARAPQTTPGEPAPAQPPSRTGQVVVPQKLGEAVVPPRVPEPVEAMGKVRPAPR